MCDYGYNYGYDPAFCPPNFTGPCLPVWCPPQGPMYKINMGNPSETIQLPVVPSTQGSSGHEFVTTAISGICADTTVTGFTNGLNANPPSVTVFVNPQKVGSCRPEKLKATMIYTHVSGGSVAGPDKYVTNEIPIPRGSTTANVYLAFAAGDEYDPSLSKIHVVLQYS